MKTIEELKKEMCERVVNFSFYKKDGSIREANGTTNLNIIPEENHPKGTDKILSNEVVRFFDVDKDEWRSFKKVYFIDINE